MRKQYTDPLELFKRAIYLRDGLTWGDFQKFRILFARRGNAPRQHSALESSIAFREFKQSLFDEPFPKPSPMQGDIILGKNPGGITRYQSKHAPSHLLAIGSTGVGKTVMLVFLLLQYLLIASGIWVFDFIKRELRGIKRLAERAGATFHVCRYEYLKINLLDPQGLNSSLYANICAEFLTLTLAMPPVAKLILKICVTELYQQSGILMNPNACPPTLSELINKVRQFEGNKAAKEAILIRLQGLLANQGHIFNVRKGLPIRELARRRIVWECDGTETSNQNLVVAYLISMLFLLRVQSRQNDLVIVALDEASRIYSKKIESAYDGPSYISQMTCTIRKMLIALMVFTQTTHDLSNSILANSGIKVLFRVGTAQDYDAFGRSMGLKPDQIQWSKTNLSIGQQIIKMGFGWQMPFLNQTPNIPIPENVTDREVNESSKSILDLIDEPAVSRLLLPPNIQDSPPDNPLDILNSEEGALYDEVLRNPGEPNATEHYINAGLNTRQGSRAKKSLIQKGLVKETPIETGKRGGAQSFLMIISTSGRYGNSLHNYLRDKADNWYRSRQCGTVKEMAKLLNGQTVYVDLGVVWPDGKTEALEVETEDSPRALQNVQKNIALGFSTVSVLTPNKKVRQAVEKRVLSGVENKLHPRIRFQPIRFYEL